MDVSVMERLEGRVFFTANSFVGPLVDDEPGGGGVGGGPDPIFAAAYAPNNSVAAASDLGTLGSAGVNIPGLTIHQSGNDDFYRFVPNFNGRVVVAIEFTHREGNLGLSVYGPDQNLIAASDGNTNRE